MRSDVKFTSAQIRYMICLLQLSDDGVGVKNIEVSKALGVRKSSVHDMFKSLGELGIITQSLTGLAVLTEYGRETATKYRVCYDFLLGKLNELCGDESASEIAVCGILSDMPHKRVDELYKSNL